MGCVLWGMLGLISGACKAHFSNDADALFLLRDLNGAQTLTSLGNRIGPAPELQELFAKPAALLKVTETAPTKRAETGAVSKSPSEGVRLFALLEDEEIIPLRIYPAGEHIQLHAVVQTEDYILLHYRGESIACPLVTISKNDYAVTCAFSAEHYLKEFDTHYPGVADEPLLERHPFILESAFQYGESVLITVGGRPYLIKPGSSPRFPDGLVEPKAIFPDGPASALTDARVNRTGDTLRYFDGFAPRMIDSVTGESLISFADPAPDLDLDLAPEPDRDLRNEGQYFAAYNNAGDFLLAGAVNFQGRLPEFVSWQRRRGALRRRVVRLRGSVASETRFSVRAQCGGNLYLMGGEIAAPVLLQVNARRARVRSVAPPAGFTGTPADLACGGKRLFAHVKNDESRTEAIHRFTVRGKGTQLVFGGEEHALSGLTAISNKRLMFIARERESGRVFLARAQRNRAWQTNLLPVASGVRGVLPLYNMGQPRTESKLPEMSVQPIFSK